VRRLLATVVLGATLAAVPVRTLAVPVTPAGVSHIHRPSIVWRPIPFGQRRRSQMGAYSLRHYGDWMWRLRDLHVIVGH
jgi:hypothetical protein